MFSRNIRLAFSGQRSDAETAENQVKLTNLGFQGLEYVLGGGLPEDSLFLLTGAPGTHYSTFANQAIYNHLVQGGKAVVYTPESPSSDLEQDFALYGWKLSRYVDDKSLIFSRPLPPQLQALSEVNSSNPMEESVALSSSASALTKDFVSKIKEGRWSILSPSYLMNVYPPQEITDLFMFWVGAVHKYGGVHFITLPEGAHDEKHVTFLKSMVDGVLNFRYVQGFGQAEGEVEVQKLRRVLPKSKVFRHTVQPDGLLIETTARIG